METPLVSIVVLNWNGLNDTLDCLQSIRQVTYANKKIIVVDNASANDEAAVIETSYPEVIVLREKENLGFCGGCNAGMKKAIEEKSDYIMLLNNDALLSPDVLGKLVHNYQQLKNPGAISPVILHYPEKEKVWFSIAKWESRWKRGEAEFRLSYNENYTDIKDKQPYESEFACGCCLFVSVEIINKIGLLDERYFAYYEEAAWCAKMRRQGYPSYVIPSAFMYHKVAPAKPNLVMTYLATRNRLLWMAGNLPFAKKLRSWPCLFKELTWNIINVFGLFPKRKQHVSQQYSRAFLRGWADYLLGRFGKWNKQTERIIFNKPR